MKDDTDFEINNNETISFPNQLTIEKEKELFFLYNQNHDSLIKEEIVLHNLWIIEHLSEKYRKFLNIPKDELKSYGYLKLIELVDKYDLNSNAKFSTFVYKCITSSYNLYTRRTVEIPCNIMEILVPIIRLVENEYCDKIENNPMELIEKVVSYLKMTNKYNDKQINNFRTALYYLYPSSFDLQDKYENKAIDIKYNINLEDFVINSSIKSKNKKIIRETLDELENLYYENGKKYKQILILKYGLDGNDIKTQQEIAKILGCTKQNVSAVEKTAMSKMKKLLMKNHNFIYDY